MMAKRGTSTKKIKPSWPALHSVGTGLLLLSAFLGSSALVGCKGFWEDQKEIMNDFYYKPDPLSVVKSTHSSDRKAKFLAQLQNPSQRGGNPQQQEEVYKVLFEIATKDPAPICRLQAIRKLGEFKDPRAVEALQIAFDNATKFGPEVNSAIRQQALRSLAQTGNPTARGELIRVAKAGAKENNSVDQQLTLDERLTAVRGLANFKGPDVDEALLHILRSEKDVALRDRANESLQTVTGRKLPPDAKAWEQALNSNPGSAIPQPKMGGPVQLIKGQK